MIWQFVGYLKEDQSKTLVHSKQVNKYRPQFRERELEGGIIEIIIIFQNNKTIHLDTLSARHYSKGFSFINSFNPHNLRGGADNDPIWHCMY